MNNGDLRGWPKITYLENFVIVPFAHLDMFDSHGASLVLSIAHDGKPSIVVHFFDA